MLSIGRNWSENRPQVFDRVSVDEYIYNYCIEEKQMYSPSHERQEGEEEPEMVEKTVYEFTPFTLKGGPNRAQCTLAVIRAYISQNDEFKLINDVRAVELGIIDGDKASKVMQRYTEYLRLRDTIKSKITEDFSNKE